MRKTGLTLLVMVQVVTAWSVKHCDAQLTQPWIVSVYEDDFSADRVRHDSWTHSVVWVEGAYPPSSPHLVFGSRGGFGTELVFNRSGGSPARLGYCFPIQPDEVLRAIPLELSIEVDVRLVSLGSARDNSPGYLQYQVSVDGVNWSAPTFLFSGSPSLALGDLRQNRYVLFSGAGVAIDNLRATIQYRPAAADLRVPLAWPTIQAAVNAANSGQHVVVADGVYRELVDFGGKNIVVMSENGPSNCIIDGQGQRPGVICVKGEGRTAVLDGFTIRNGREMQGGAIYCLGSRPTISNCIIQDCQSSSSFGPGQGGAIYCEQATPLIQDCFFVNNESTSSIYGGQGGAIYVAESAAAVIERCHFEGNRAVEGNAPSNSGGGVFVNTSIVTAQTLGKTILRNCVFSNNHAGDDGGAVYLQQCTSLIVNCTIAGNRADNYGGGLFANLSTSLSDMNLVKNSIVWGNSPDDLAKSGAFAARNLVVEYSNVSQGWGGDGRANYSVDPRFADPGGGDYRLRSYAGRWDPDQAEWVHDFEDSPCLDLGSLQEPSGSERIPHGSLINLGAYGGTPQASRGKGPLVLHVAKGGNDQNSGLLRSEAFPTIKSAVAVAVDGDVVMVWPGTYREEVIFDTKAITIQSAADAAIVTAPSNYAFSFYQGEVADSVLRNIVIADCPKGAVWCVSSKPTLHNLTIVNCGMGINAEENASQTDVSNCVFLDNAVGDVLGCMASYSCGFRPLDGVGNIRAEPLLVDVDNGDFHQQSEFGSYKPQQNIWIVPPGARMSPGIDAGDPAVDPVAEPSPNGGLLNMGAHGGTGYASLSPQ